MCNPYTMLDASFAMTMVVMGFLFPFGITAALFIKLFSILDGMFSSPKPAHVLPCPATTSMVHLLAVPLFGVCWPL
jgi:hypothetical protein